MRTCCFTGHRVLPTEASCRIAAALSDTIDALYQEGVRDFICGGAIGFDTLAARIVLLKKETYPDMRLLLTIPCRDQAKNWTRAQKQMYADILDQADVVEYLADTYDSGCMHRRNRHMVDHADVCVAYYVGKRGGTAYTVNYAYQEGVRVILIQ